VENKEKEKEEDSLAGRKVDDWIWADRRVAVINGNHECIV
jgi:hypothetical protein